MHGSINGMRQDIKSYEADASHVGPMQPAPIHNHWSSSICSTFGPFSASLGHSSRYLEMADLGGQNSRRGSIAQRSVVQRQADHPARTEIKLPQNTPPNRIGHLAFKVRVKPHPYESTYHLHPASSCAILHAVGPTKSNDQSTPTPSLHVGCHPFTDAALAFPPPTSTPNDALRDPNATLAQRSALPVNIQTDRWSIAQHRHFHSMNWPAPGPSTNIVQLPSHRRVRPFPIVLVGRVV